MKTLPTLFLTSALSSLLPVTAQTPSPQEQTTFQTIHPKMNLAEGDTVVFLGDSITHQCLYTQYVEDYFYTRHPGTRLRFHNAGVGGDRAQDALRRFDADVAAFKPKYVTILLGMNDGTYRGFDQPTFDTYERDMKEVLDRIKAIGAVAIPMTPTMHDSRAQRVRGKAQEPRDTYYNGVLAFYGTWLREQAESRGLGFVDMWSPLNNLTLQQRKTDANWTMIKDGVHPGPVGQTVMATAIINDMVARGPVAQTTLTWNAEKPAGRTANGTLSNLAATATSLSFTLESKSLPWVLPPDAAEGVKLTKLGHRYSNEKLVVKNLPAGTYELAIDGTVVGSWTDAQLSTGVELEENPATPQYQQAAKVAALNKERNDKFYQPIRGQYSQLKGRQRTVLTLERNQSADLAKAKEEFETWHKEMQSKVANLLTDARAAEVAIYDAAQPKPHQYTLSAKK